MKGIHGLTELLKHLVALVENEVLDVLQVELLAADEGQDAAGGADDNVGAVGLQDLLVLGDGQSTEEDTDLKRKSQLKNPIPKIFWSSRF